MLSTVVEYPALLKFSFVILFFCGMFFVVHHDRILAFPEDKIADTLDRFIKNAPHFMLCENILYTQGHLKNPDLLPLTHVNGFCVYAERDRVKLPVHSFAKFYMDIEVKGPLYFRRTNTEHPRPIRNRVNIHGPIPRISSQMSSSKLACQIDT